jgi:hypothetical protein
MGMEIYFLFVHDFHLKPVVFSTSFLGLITGDWSGLTITTRFDAIRWYLVQGRTHPIGIVPKIVRIQLH